MLTEAKIDIPSIDVDVIKLTGTRKSKTLIVENAIRFFALTAFKLWWEQ